MARTLHDFAGLKGNAMKNKTIKILNLCPDSKKETDFHIWEWCLEQSKAKYTDDLVTWCLEQAAARYKGTLPKEQFDKLQEIEFPWAYYEKALDELGFDWKANNPNGKRWTE